MRRRERFGIEAETSCDWIRVSTTIDGRLLDLINPDSFSSSWERSARKYKFFLCLSPFEGSVIGGERPSFRFAAIRNLSKSAYSIGIGSYSLVSYF